MQPFSFEESNKFLCFDYEKCFPAWGYDPEVDGPDKLITVTVEDDDEL